MSCIIKLDIYLRLRNNGTPHHILNRNRKIETMKKEKKKLIKFIKDSRIESVEIRKPPPETVYMNEIAVGERQLLCVEIYIIAYPN